MTEQRIKNSIGAAFKDIAEGLKTGSFGKKTKIGLTTLGSEHGVDNLVKGAELAARMSNDLEIILIGPKNDSEFKNIQITEESEMHSKMEELLKTGEIDACVTMHYNFPIGISTVGQVQTPAMGKNMFLATTTGTSSPDRTQSMVINALSGIVTAKAMGIKNPSLGILNLDGARKTLTALEKLDKGGYTINFGDSLRSDGGSVMRGNDLLAGTTDIMVTDSLTGNVMMKMFSSYSTGGSYEATGAGYGPGVGANMESVVLILSRASGIPVVANALIYASKLIQGNILAIAKEEFGKAEKAGLSSILKDLKPASTASNNAGAEIKAPAKEVTTGQISGIDILDLEDAVTALWAEGIYAESGMGCTGPIVMVAEDKIDRAIKALSKAGYMASEQEDC